MNSRAREVQRFLDTISQTPPAPTYNSRTTTTQSTLDRWLFPGGNDPSDWTNTQTRSRNNHPQKVTPAIKLKIATLNCPGISAITQAGQMKRQAIIVECKKRKVDILALQETHSTAPLQSLSGFFKYRSFQSIGSAAGKPL